MQDENSATVEEIGYVSTDCQTTSYAVTKTTYVLPYHSFRREVYKKAALRNKGVLGEGLVFVTEHVRITYRPAVVAKTVRPATAVYRPTQGIL